VTNVGTSITPASSRGLPEPRSCRRLYGPQHLAARRGDTGCRTNHHAADLDRDRSGARRAMLPPSFHRGEAPSRPRTNIGASSAGKPSKPAHAVHQTGASPSVPSGAWGPVAMVPFRECKGATPRPTPHQGRPRDQSQSQPRHQKNHNHVSPTWGVGTCLALYWPLATARRTLLFKCYSTGGARGLLGSVPIPLPHGHLGASTTLKCIEMP
jgi:hypothetical protein